MEDTIEEMVGDFFTCVSRWRIEEILGLWEEEILAEEERIWVED